SLALTPFQLASNFTREVNIDPAVLKAFPSHVVNLTVKIFMPAHRFSFPGEILINTVMRWPRKGHWLLLATLNILPDYTLCATRANSGRTCAPRTPLWYLFCRNS